MSVVKSLVGSVVGAAIATGIYYGIQQSTGETYVWFPLVTGALTGIVARVLGGPTSNAASFVCGALAALIAGVAIFGVDLGPKFMAMNAERGPIAKSELLEDPANLVKGVGAGNVSPNKNEESDDENTEADSKDESEEADNKDSGSGVEENSDVPTDLSAEMADRSRVPEEAKRAEAAAAGAVSNAGALPKKTDTWVSQYLPYIFNGIGILFAYQIARGFGSSKPADGKNS